MALAALFLAIPALINGYPLLFPDSGSYLALAVVAEELPYRTLVYPALLGLLGVTSTLWGVVAFQALLVAFVLDTALEALTDRYHAIWLLVLAAVLALATGLPWYAGQIMPDVFTGTLVLALCLLFAYGDRLSLWRRIGLFLVAVLGTAIHASHLPVALALGAIGMIALRLVGRPLRSALAPIAAVMLGILTVPAVHYAETGRAYMSKAGELFVFARLVEDGIVGRYLNDNCPQPGTVLCAFRDQMPGTHNAYLWDDTQAFVLAGGWDQSGPESRRIMIETLRLYPGMHIVTALDSFARQLVMVRTGDYLRTTYHHNAGVIETLLPWEAGAYHNALQQQHRLQPFDWLNLVHVPVQLAACVAMFWLAVRRWRAGDRRNGGLCAMILLGLMANAFVCATLSNPQDRYQNRVVWIAVFTAGALTLPNASLWKPQPTHRS